MRKLTVSTLDTTESMNIFGRDYTIAQMVELFVRQSIQEESDLVSVNIISDTKAYITYWN